MRSPRGYDGAGVGGGEFALRLVPRQRVAPLYWRSSSHTHTHTYSLSGGLSVGTVLLPPFSGHVKVDMVVKYIPVIKMVVFIAVLE